MRHTSERVPGKNYRPFAGQPLYHHIVETLLACPTVSEVVIDTDSDRIMEDARRQFPTVTLLRRPAHLRAGTVSMNEVLLHDTTQIQADLYLQTHSTNPLLATETINHAVASFLRGYPRQHDSLFSVTALHTRLWDRRGHALNHDPRRLIRTQDLPPLYEENSCLYLFTAKTLVERGSRIGARPLLFPIPAEEAWDIDEELDFHFAEYLCQQRRGERRC